MAERKPPPQPPPSERERAQQIAQALAVGSFAAGAAGGSAAAVAALAAPPRLSARGLAALTRLWLSWGYSRETVRHGLRISTRILPTGPGPGGSPVPPGPAREATDRHARFFTAWFLERTTARTDAALRAGEDLEAVTAREDRWLEQHLDAQDKRDAAAGRVDTQAAKPGQVTTDRGEDVYDPDNDVRVILKWRAHPDDKTTPECAAADGAWFYADTPPVIGYPGMPHGGTCRCWPAHAGSLAEVARGRHVDEAVRAILATDTAHRPHPGTRPERMPA